MTEEEIRKEVGNQNAGQILGLHEKEVGAEPDQHHRKTFRRFR
jgi:aromatic ring-cleaving dioxygenase